ncbi:DivIVA domain-containing protein, partial [Nocardia cyriacigeorgica]|uniref:DivIVA domain-containing protein n=1 Tax=Nocardia cyriacigeorgica TaxID=135487 RepID=UPI002454E6F1
MTAVTPEDVGRTTFALTPPGLRGYRTDEVDAFLELVAATLGGSGVLTADDLRQVSFGAPRGGRRGYRAEQVDEFLDRVHAELEFRQRGVRPVPAAAPGPGPAGVVGPAGVDRVGVTPAPRGQGGDDLVEVDGVLEVV